MLAYLRGKRLVHDYPLRVASFDGKCTPTFILNPSDAKHPCAQINSATGQAKVRTITVCLTSTPARPCIDMHPLPPEQNEISVFAAAMDATLGAYGRKLFDVVMYEPGAASLAIANAVVQRGLDYVFVLSAFAPTLLAEATRLMGGKALDTAFIEDLRPWLMGPQGMLVMNQLRRMEYNALAIFQSVTTLAETKRAIVWPELLQRTYDALIRATQATVEGLARRETVLG